MRGVVSLVSSAVVLLGVIALADTPQRVGAVVVAAAAQPDAGLALTERQAEGAKLFLTRTCFGCHGKDAKTPILPDYPKIAGQNQAYIVRQMRDIKSGARANGNTAAMRGIMPLVADAEIEVIADYVASLPR